MDSQHLITLLVIYFSAVLTMALASWSRRRNPWLAGFVAATSLISLGAVVLLAAFVTPGRNVAITMASALFDLNRPHCVAAAIGLSLALPWIVILAPRGSADGRQWWSVLFLEVSLLLTFVAGGLMSSKEILSRHLANPKALGGSNLLGGKCDPGFELELLATTEIIPIRIAVDSNDRIFVSGQRGVAAQSGGVVELYRNDATGKYEEKLVANMLNRPYGLAIHKGDLYVSRSGQFTRAVNGKLIHEATGAVTRLRDLDGDGIFDFYEDVVSGLPGSRGSDYLHQNNGIVFDAAGALYITSGGNSNSDPPLHPWEGTILKTDADFKEVRVFASGFRNPFGITLGPEGRLFCTDNDVSADTGDELNLVIEGRHHGHPYATEGQGSASVPPILLSKSALAGLVYTESPDLPPEYRSCFYVVNYGADNISRVRLVPEGETYKAMVFSFASISQPVDIAVSPHGVFYIASYHTREVYRLRYTGK